ncbi:KUN-2, putative [Ixodes scapularis]|uniref:KUN-2, putative n=1 Tax=Ixodes scapularis TaxID=6945 RepID=B7QEZ8_IXOSC|nr:KUN-2, putative [Ixodes scapularis]|eukprot:XP_002414112.1 KUN-2, putative [Ixodes scapularis]
MNMNSYPAIGCGECETTGTVPAICKKDPEKGEGRADHPGWFYDYNIDSCLRFSFGAIQAVNEEVNRFETKENCSKTCRPHVKSFCFDEPPKTSHGSLNRKWFYNSTQAKCFIVNIKGEAPEHTNVFNTEDECNKTCRDPDYGPCAKPLPGPCKETDTDYYRYNIETERCFYDSKWRCGGENAFYFREACDKRCGRFVQDKCKHRPQDISDWCTTMGNRSYYDETEDMCKTYYGCDDHGIGFYNERHCNQACRGKSP